MNYEDLYRGMRVRIVPQRIRSLSVKEEAKPKTGVVKYLTPVGAGVIRDGNTSWTVFLASELEPE